MGRVVDLTEYLFGLVTEEVVCPFTIFFCIVYRDDQVATYPHYFHEEVENTVMYICISS